MRRPMMVATTELLDGDRQVVLTVSSDSMSFDVISAMVAPSIAAARGSRVTHDFGAHGICNPIANDAE